MASNQDHISLLPMTPLITILSLLPLKEAVRTSVLAKQWRNLWRFRTNIEINEHHFSAPNNHDHNPNNNHTDVQNEEQRRQISCINFGRGLLDVVRDNNNLPFSSFTLVFSEPRAHQQFIDNFIFYVLKRGIKSLELDFSGLDWDDRLPIISGNIFLERFDLPHIVYQYQCLESLKLVSCGFRADQFTFLGRALKKVSLAWVEIENPSTLSNVVGSCSLLENLSLCKCFGSTEYLIESESLRELVIDQCVDLLKITVRATNLRRLKYRGSFVEFSMNYFRSLEEADLNFALQGLFDYENGDKVLQLLSRVRFAKSLGICAFITQMLPMAMENLESRLSGRAHIQDLTIKTSFHKFEFVGILCLLNSYPLLEKLRFEVGYQTIFEEDMAPFVNWNGETFWDLARLGKNGCVKNKLKVVEIDGFRGIANEQKLLTFLLAHGKNVLQTLVLKVDESHDNNAAREVAIQIRRACMVHFEGVNVVVIP